MGSWRRHLVTLVLDWHQQVARRARPAPKGGAEMDLESAPLLANVLQASFGEVSSENEKADPLPLLPYIPGGLGWNSCLKPK